MYRSRDAPYTESFAGSVNSERTGRKRKQPVVLLHGTNRDIYQDVRSVHSYAPSEASMDTDRFTVANPRLNPGRINERGLRGPRNTSSGSQGGTMDSGIAGIGGYMSGVPYYAVPEDYYDRVYLGAPYVNQGYEYYPEDLVERGPLGPPWQVNRPLSPSEMMLRESERPETRAGRAVPIKPFAPISPLVENNWETASNGGHRSRSKTLDVNQETYYRKPFPPRTAVMPHRVRSNSDNIRRTPVPMALGQQHARPDYIPGRRSPVPGEYNIPYGHPLSPRPLQDYPDGMFPLRSRTSSRESILEIEEEEEDDLRDNARLQSADKKQVQPNFVANNYGLNASTDSVFVRADNEEKLGGKSKADINALKQSRQSSGSAGELGDEQKRQQKIPTTPRILVNDLRAGRSVKREHAQETLTREGLRRKRSQSWCADMDRIDQDISVPALRRNSWSPETDEVLLAELNAIAERNRSGTMESEEDDSNERIRNWAMAAEIAMMEEDTYDIDMDVRSTLESSFSPYSTTESSRRQPETIYDYTVKRSTKDPPSGALTEDSCYNFYAGSAKWIVSVIVFLVLLFCVTANKICLLVIGHRYTLFVQKSASLVNMTNVTASNSTSGANTEDEIAGKEAIFLMLVLIIMVPQAVSLLYAVWGKRNSQPWPSKTASKWILVGGLIEVSSLVFLCVVAPTALALPPDLFVLLMSALFLVPTVWQAYKARKKWRTRNGKVQMAIFTVATALQLEGLVVLVMNERVTSLKAKIGIPVALFFLSLAWSPRIRKLQTRPRPPQNPSQHPTAEAHSATGKIRKKAARAKAAILMSCVKVLLTPVMSLIFCRVFEVAEISELGSGFSSISSMGSTFNYFMVQIFSTYLGYHMAWLACAMCIQKIGFALPLTLATPLAFLFVQLQELCDNSVVPLPCGPADNLSYVVAVGLFIWLGQFISTGYYVWKSNGYIMGKANHLFWLPSYNGPLLEPNLLLNRRNEVTDVDHVSQKHLSRDTYVFICTTMYHEEDYEMEQLLTSLHDIDCASKKAGRHIESHIFFDGCINAEKMNSYILQLVSLVENTLKIKVQKCVKVMTPYGMQLRWQLPGGMPFTVHLKDNSKVKNKKRWSQVMYMSYVLDYKQKMLNVRDDQTFILTTDADVNFTNESMEALIDYMLQDESIGAVCGRTHPMGKGPLVWYQIFDYAIGHWFMKVANHMFGSVLCCPGCFSLYRCQAVRDILPTYSTNVNEAFEFLTKDMGEDRWMCTLMVQKGWRLTYCAAAEDMTYCPMSFDEFYKQRRRWMPSTLANLALLISEWRVTLKNNEYVSFPFIVFQMFLLGSTIIGPSTVILVIVGGMVQSGIAAEPNATTTVLSIVTVAYGLICLFLSQDFQLKVAKVLTFIFAIVMIVVTIGIAVQINDQIMQRQIERNLPTMVPNTTATPYPTKLSPMELKIPADISTLYLAGLMGIFVSAAALHPTEAYCVINGFFYLLCLPSGYLFLTIYSVVNMTDRSWGTREGKEAKTAQTGNQFLDIWNTVKSKLSCCCTLVTKVANRRKSKKEKKKQEEMKEKEMEEKNRKNSKDLDERSEKRRRKRRRRRREKRRPESNDSSGSGYSGNESSSFYSSDETEMDYRRAKAKSFDRQSQAGRRDGSTHHGSLTADEGFSNFAYELELDLGTAGLVDDPYTGRPRRLTPSELSYHLQVSNNDPTAAQIVDPDCPECQQSGSCPRHPASKKGSSLPERGRLDSALNAYAKDANRPHSFDRALIHSSISEDVVCDAIHPATRQRISLQEGAMKHRGRAASVASSPGRMVSGARRLSQGSYMGVPVGNIHTMTSQEESGYTSGNSLSISRMNTFEMDEAAYAKSWAGLPMGRRPPPFQVNSALRHSALGNKRISASMSDLGTFSMDDMTMSNLFLSRDNDLNMTVEEWIGQSRLQVYIPNFKEHGYDNLKFISMMTEKDLETIGIKIRGHKQRLVREVKRIPRLEIDEGIPENVDTWLDSLSLKEYWPFFVENSYTEPSDLEDLKSMGRDLVMETFKVYKMGHITMLWQAIRKLQYPNTGQVKSRQARRELDRCATLDLVIDNNDDGAEYDFWDGLRQACLMPELAGFDGNTGLKDKLAELRNSTVFIFLITNILWMIIILVLVQQNQLKVLGVDIVGLAFLCVYGTIMVLEFLAMLAHRLNTVIHILSRAPYVCGVHQNNLFIEEPEEVVVES